MLQIASIQSWSPFSCHFKQLHLQIFKLLIFTFLAAIADNYSKCSKTRDCCYNNTIKWRTFKINDLLFINLFSCNLFSILRICIWYVRLVYLLLVLHSNTISLCSHSTRIFALSLFVHKSFKHENMEIEYLCLNMNL